MKTQEIETITEEQEIERGIEIARVLQLKPAKYYDGSSRGKAYNPPRYETTHGTKTALGLFRTMQCLIERGRGPE